MGLFAVFIEFGTGGDARLGEITAVVWDAAEIRAFECALPDDVEISAVAARLAELAGLPASDPNGHDVAYGLMVRGGALLNSSSVLGDHDLPDGVTLRLLPEIVAGHEDSAAPAEPDDESTHMPCEKVPVRICEPVMLLPEIESAGRPQVRIDVGARREIARFAERDRSTECAGLLLGDMSFEGGERIVHIRAAIPADCARGTRATVRITHQSWESMMETRDSQFPDLRLLGWFHTHAGWGVFMSELDVFIQRSFFHHPNMVAYVLDPTTGRDGFFVWQDGGISLAPSFAHVGGDAPERERTEPAPARAARRPDLRDAAIVALAAGVVYLGFFRSPQVSPIPAAPEAAVERAAQTTAPPEVHQRDAEYVIGPGDSPWSICQRVYGSGALGEALARYNGLDDVSGLQIGQRIKLPPREKLEASVGE